MTRLKGKARARASKKRRLKNKYETSIYKGKMLAKIRKFDDPILRQKCELVEDNEDICQIIRDLKGVLAITKDGVGLAAPQINYLKNIVAIRPNIKSNNITILINPEIIKHNKIKVVELEACLSFPGVFAPVERYEVITVSYLNEENKKIVKEFRKKEARIIAHEIDHLAGICLVGDKWEQEKQKK